MTPGIVVKNEAESEKQQYHQLQQKMKDIKKNVSSTRQAIRDARAQLNELFKLEAAALLDEKQRIQAAKGDVRAALGRDKNGQPILPGSFWSDVFITKRHREILAPGLQNEIRRLENRLERYQTELLNTQEKLKRSRRTRLKTWASSLLNFPIQSASSEAQLVHDDLSEKTDEGFSEMPIISMTEKAMMQKRLEQINFELEKSNKFISEKNNEMAMRLNEKQALNKMLVALQSRIILNQKIQQSFLYRLWDKICDIWGWKHTRKLDFQTDLENEQKIQADLKNKNAQISQIEDDTKITQQNINSFCKEKKELETAIGQISEEKTHKYMLEIIFREDTPEIQKLLRECKCFSLDYSGKHSTEVRNAVEKVRTALSNFLNKPTISQLYQLNQILQDNPAYSKSFKLYQLVRDCCVFYPEIRMTTEPFLPISINHLDGELQKKIDENQKELNVVNIEIEQMNSKYDLQILSDVLENKEALENAHILSIILCKQRDIFIKNNMLPLEEKSKSVKNSTSFGKIQHKIQQCQSAIKKYNEKINEIDEKKRYIGKNLPDKMISEIDKDMAKKRKSYEEYHSIDSFVKSKTHHQRLELVELLNQIVILSMQIEEHADSLLEIEQSYVVNPKLKSVTLPKNAEETIQRQKELREKQITLEQENQSLKEQLASLQATNLAPIIQSCREQTYYNNPITKALGRFLMVPTESNLQILLDKMKADPSYTKNKKLLPILEEAGKFYPIPISVSEKSAVASCLQIKESLNKYAQESGPQESEIKKGMK